MATLSQRKLTLSIRYTQLFAYASVLVALSIASLVLYLYYFGESGGGVHRDSPDGKYHAHASNYWRRNLHGVVEERLEIIVTENSTGCVIWRIKFNDAAGGKIPEYRAISEKAVRWADDSKSVRVVVSDDRELNLTVP